MPRAQPCTQAPTGHCAEPDSPLPTRQGLGTKSASKAPGLGLHSALPVFSKSASQGHGDSGCGFAVGGVSTCVCAHAGVHCVRVHMCISVFLHMLLCTQYSFHCPLTPLCTRVRARTHTHAHTQRSRPSGTRCSGPGGEGLLSLGAPRFGFRAYPHVPFAASYPESPPPPPANIWVPVKLWHQCHASPGLWQPCPGPSKQGDTYLDIKNSQDLEKSKGLRSIKG